MKLLMLSLLKSFLKKELFTLEPLTNLLQSTQYSTESKSRKTAMHFRIEKKQPFRLNSTFYGNGGAQPN